MDNLQHPDKYLNNGRKPFYPFHPTGFIGREDDVHKVQAMLGQTSCRLISLVGPGGIGKTRLGTELAMQQQSQFEDGAYFVPLQGLSSVRQVAPTIANSIACELYGNQDTLTQLQHYLQDKEMLLLLDNFEHLLDAAHVVFALLDAAPRLKILVTSREVLNLRAEWVWFVTGMRFPDEVDAEINADDSAVHLFNRCAQRLVPDFDLEQEKAHVIRICQLVGGVPLAIELAATWLKSLTCEMITQEIQRNLDFLATNMRDMPERHRNMRAVIDQSWKLLTAQEQDTFKRLSVFRGGFSSIAGDQVIGASRVVLGALVDKSLLYYNDGRYHVHELFRQYAWQYLNMEHDQAEQLLEAHASYYVQFLAQRLHTFRSTAGVLNEILIEIDNIYLAWERVLSGKQFDQLPSAIYCFGGVLNYCMSRHEGIEMFAPAIAIYREQENPPEALPTYAALLTTQSVYHTSLMQLNEAVTLLEDCQSLLEQYDFRPQPYAGSDPLVRLGIAHLFQGHFERALTYGHQAVANGEKHDDIPNSSMANQLLGMTFLALGRPDEAMQYGQLALSQSRQTKNRVMSAFCSDHLGDTAMLAGDPEMAERYYKDGYQYRKEIHELTNLPLSMSLIGKAKLAQRHYAKAVEWLSKSIDLYTTYNDTANLIVPKSQLALCYAYMDDIQQAHDVFVEAIYAAEITQVVPLWLVLMSCVGEFLIQLGDTSKGVELLSTVIHHPMFNRGRDMATDIGKKLEELEKTLPEDQYFAARQAGMDANFTATAHALEHYISSALLNMTQPPASQDETYDTYIQSLEPLSSRELEVLELIAAGMTNQQIAERLNVTVGTVKSHNHTIFSKLGVKNRTQATKIAREHKLI